MRIKLPVRRSLFFVGAFALALIALLPMRLGIDWLGLGSRGFAARQVEGSIWHGVIREAQFGKVGLGDLQAGLNGMPLFLGRARIGLERDGSTAEDRLGGAATVTRHTFGFDDLAGRLQLAGAFGPLPLSQLDLGDVTARFEDGRCIEAAGSVRAAVAGDMAGIALPGGLTGHVRCDGGALLIPLVSQSSMEALELRLSGDGRYQAVVRIRSADPALGGRLTAAGFVAAGGGYALTVSGNL